VYEYQYPHPAVSVDIVAISLIETKLCLRLIKRSHSPYKGHWALPGGFVHIDETLDAAARRVLLEETGIRKAYWEQLYTFGEPNRDPRERVISVAYLVLIPMHLLQNEAWDEAAHSQWFAVQELPRLAFDHSDMILQAHMRLISKLDYSSIAFCLLPEKFTLSQVQEIYEHITQKAYEKRNFRKQLLSREILKDTGEQTKGAAHRPAKLFQLKNTGRLQYWN